MIMLRTTLATVGILTTKNIISMPVKLLTMNLINAAWELALLMLMMLEYVGINSSSDFLDQVESQMDSNDIYYFEFQIWNLALQPA